MQRFEHPRRNDWNIRFTEFLKDSMQIGSDLCIDWDSEGTTCFSWVGMGVEEITGFNPHDQFVGKYSNLLGICKYIRMLGYHDFDSMLAAMYEEVPIGFAQTGDIALVNIDWGDVAPETVQMLPHATALVDPPFYYAVTEKGLVKGDLYLHGVRTFAVGRKVK